MNLALHTGWLGAFEAGVIAFATGLLLFALLHWIGKRAGWPQGHALGWSALAALVAAAGIDAWLLFRMGVMRLESPLYARIFLAGIHDPGFLHVRVVFEAVGALAGAVAGWIIAERRSARARPDG